MTTLTKDIAAKFAVAAVAVAMIFSAYAPAAQAQTTEDLQQMINDLLAQVALLQEQATGDVSAPAGAPAVCPYTWTRDLTMGSEGADVMKLQQFLNSYPDLRVAAAGSAGSAGMETMYYGPATAAAVSKMQVMFRAEILTPNALVNPTGYFGASSRAKANDLCVTPVVDAGDEDEDGMEEEDEDEDDGPVTLSGEATLDNFELDDGESTLEEGDEEVSIGEVTVEFTDGDAEISRIDLSLSSSASDEDPWDVYETISLWVDGDMIAEENADDEDDYLDENAGELRFSNLDLVGMEDEELEIIVAATLQNNLDNDAFQNDWRVQVTSMRFFDADGVAETVEDPADGEFAEFEIQEAGTDEELNVSLSSSNPDATDIIVDVDQDTNDVTIMVADLEAEDNDIELNTIVVAVETTIGDISDVIDDIRLVIDGQSFDAESLGTESDYDASADEASEDGLSQGKSERADAANTIWYLFDIDGDVVIDEGDEIEMEVVVDFNDTDETPTLNYANGTTIKASVASTETDEWDAEGADDLANGQFSGSAVGDAHTLVAEGIVVPADSFSAETDTLGNDDTIGEFTLEFDVTAVEGDFYIAEAAGTSTQVSSTTGGVMFSVSGTVGTGSVTASLDSTGDFSTDDAYTVREGETETFTLTVTIDPENTGTFRVTLNEVYFSNDTDGIGADAEVYMTMPASDFRTNTQAIQG